MLKQRIVSYPDIKTANKFLEEENQKGWRAISVAVSISKGIYISETMQITYILEKETKEEQNAEPE